jgi:glycosyltransferase involved in cell wall biosynthesis
MRNTWACIAAKNEAETIGELVTRLRRVGFNVVVTDDGSDDATYHEASKAGAYLVFHDRCEGIAASVMDAWSVALEEGAERIVQMDAGGSHDPGHALVLAQSLPRQGVDMVIGSRFLLHSLYYGRRWRALMSRVAAAACSIKAGRWITDWTSGLRAFTDDALFYLSNFCDYGARMHGWQIEVLGKAIKAGFSIAEVPIVYTAGASSFDCSVACEAFRAWRRL